MYKYTIICISIFSLNAYTHTKFAIQKHENCKEEAKKESLTVRKQNHMKLSVLLVEFKHSTCCHCWTENRP